MMATASIHHPVRGTALQYVLRGEIARVRRDLATSPQRAARTLVKDGPLRVTLLALRAGGTVAAHRAEGPVTLQMLVGSMVVDVEGVPRELVAGTLMALEAGAEHSVSSVEGGCCLLTVAHRRPGASGDE